MFSDLFNGKQWLTALRGVGEDAATVASGTGASIAGGLAGLTTPVTNAIGLTNEQPANVVRGIQEKYTYQPKPSQAEHIASQALSIPGRIANRAGEITTDATGSPGAGAFVNTALQSAPALLGLRGARSAEVVQPKPVEVSAEQAAIKQAADAGYKLTPTQTGAKIGSALEGISGQAALERSVSHHNQGVTNRLAAKEIGLPEGAPITSQTLAPIKSKANAVYSEVGKLGPVTTDATYRAAVEKAGGKSGDSFPLDVDPRIQKLTEAYAVEKFNAADAVQKTRQLRADATKNIKAPNAPEQNALGYAQRAVSDALEAQLERHAQAAGKSDLVKRFQAARQQLAKVHTVENALSPRGNVSAIDIAKQADRGVPVSGGFKTIADTATSFKKSLQDVEKIRHHGPFSVIDYVVGGAAALHNPALAATIISRPLIRAGLKSNAYQKGLAATAKPRNALAPTRKNALSAVPSAQEQP